MTKTKHSSTKTTPQRKQTKQKNQLTADGCKIKKTMTTKKGWRHSHAHVAHTHHWYIQHTSNVSSSAALSLTLGMAMFFTISVNVSSAPNRSLCIALPTTRVKNLMHVVASASWCLPADTYHNRNPMPMPMIRSESVVLIFDNPIIKKKWDDIIRSETWIGISAIFYFRHKPYKNKRQIIAGVERHRKSARIDSDVKWMH